MPQNFADRLLAAIDKAGSPVCVGIDPVPERLPPDLKTDTDGVHAQLAAVRTFCLGVLDAVAPIVPVVKPQSAYFEVFGGVGVALYFEIVREAHRRGLVVIGDVKRGDIGSTAAAYARAHLRADDAPDAITVNGYFGSDGIAPFLTAARDTGRGVFLLVRTSNPSSREVQMFSDPAGRRLYQHVARHTAELGRQEGFVGERGYSLLGAVVGATQTFESTILRKEMPEQIFLAPGYGAQGATADDCAEAFRADGTGGIVNASRSVLYAFEKADPANWTDGVAAAAQAFADDIREAIDRRRNRLASSDKS